MPQAAEQEEQTVFRDMLLRKNLGAFYTPEPYARKSLELLEIAIGRVPKGNDYVIIDRCAGTGNLERGMDDEILSHCILSTVEPREHQALQEAFGSKARHVLPLSESDALSEAFVSNPTIRQYVDDPGCTIILFENPPFAETTSIEHQRRGAGKQSSTWKRSFVVKEMKKRIKGTASNDLANAFIWSAFEHYLRQAGDSYVVYAPVKYWKAHHLIDRKLLKGFAFNRRHFHTNTDACIMVALWDFEPSNVETIEIQGFDIAPKGQLLDCGMLPVSRVHSTFSQKFYDRRVFPDDEPGIIAEFNGAESVRKPQGIRPIANRDILGYLTVKGNNFDNPDASAHLLRVAEYDGHGFYLRQDAYLDKLPMFCASRYISYNRGWTERARIMKSGDGADRFSAAVSSGKLDQWLLKCLLFTCLEMHNHMRTFIGSDGRFYRNELCLDTTNGETLATLDLSRLRMNGAEKKLVEGWRHLMGEVVKTPEYDSALTYGVYQIHIEIDTSRKNGGGKTRWNHAGVHSALKALKAQVKDYYNDEIVPPLFEYEFLK